MGWRDRDWAKFTDAERDALYGRTSTSSGPPPAYVPARSRHSVVAPGVGLAIVVSAGVLLLGHFPRTHPILPALHFGSTRAVVHITRTYPLNLSPSASYGSTLTLNGTDPNATSGTVVASGQWNGGPWTTLASTTLAADHAWNVPLAMNQQGTLNIRITLPSGDVLVGSVTVQP